MYNKNLLFYNTHENYKNVNLLLAKNKSKKTLLTYNKKWTKNVHELIIYNII